MGDYTLTKTYETAMYPVHASQTSGLLRRCEPLLQPQQVISRWLKGIPLRMQNGDFITDDEMKDYIMVAMNDAELLLGRTITREAFKEKLPFDYNLYKTYIHLRAEHGPIVSLEHLAIVSSDNNLIFEIPPTWIEAANFSKNLINVIPLLAAYGVNSVQGAVGNAGIAFLTVIDGLNWVPAYWQIKYTAGLSNKEGLVPVPVNELVGVITAIHILSMLAPLFIHTSQSLSQDGISQSSSGPGPRIYQLRIEELMAQRDELVRKLRGIFSSKYFIDNF
jgi:hypothetical protein